MTTTTTTRMSKKTYNERLRVLMEVTAARAGTAGFSVVVPHASPKEVWRLDGKDIRDVKASLSGMAELQSDQECDECLELLPRGHTVAGKVILWERDGGILQSRFHCTCIPCFVQDRGGYLSSAVVALVMET